MPTPTTAPRPSQAMVIVTATLLSLVVVGFILLIIIQGGRRRRAEPASQNNIELQARNGGEPEEQWSVVAAVGSDSQSQSAL